MSPPGRHGPAGATSWPWGEYRKATSEGILMSESAALPVLLLVDGSSYL